MEGVATAVVAGAAPQVGAAGAGEGVEERYGGEDMEVTEEEAKTTPREVTLEKVTSEMGTLEVGAMKKPGEVPRERKADKKPKLTEKRDGEHRHGKEEERDQGRGRREDRGNSSSSRPRRSGLRESGLRTSSPGRPHSRPNSRPRSDSRPGSRPGSRPDSRSHSKSNLKSDSRKSSSSRGREKDTEKREDTSSAHKRSASISSSQNLEAKRKQGPENTETLRETEGETLALILEAEVAERKEEEDCGEVAEEDVKMDVEEGAKEDKNQNSLPGRQVGLNRSNGY